MCFRNKRNVWSLFTGIEHFKKSFDVFLATLIERDRGRIRRHRLRIWGLADRGSRRQRIGLEERRWSFSKGFLRWVTPQRAIQETMARRTGGNIIERFETPRPVREKKGKGRSGTHRSGPIKYNYFPIEWKLFGNECWAIDDIHTFIKRLSSSFWPFLSSSSGRFTIRRPRILFRSNTYLEMQYYTQCKELCVGPFRWADNYLLLQFRAPMYKVFHKI